MPDEEELLDEKGAVDALNKALALQYRSALQYSLTSSSLTGIPAQAIGGLLIECGDRETVPRCGQVFEPPPAGARQLVRVHRADRAAGRLAPDRDEQSADDGRAGAAARAGNRRKAPPRLRARRE